MCVCLRECACIYHLHDLFRCKHDKHSFSDGDPVTVNNAGTCKCRLFLQGCNDGDQRINANHGWFLSEDYVCVSTAGS
jgi:hypothetical protein